MAQPIAQLAGVCKSFGATLALDELDLDVMPGEVLGLLGPNGAGKTTTISILIGQRRADRGSVRLFGQDPSRPTARTRLGVTPQGSDFPRTLRVAEVIDLVRAHYPNPRATSALLTEFGLAEIAARQTGGLSGGQRRRLAVALAFAGDPEFVVLDEPTTGLDARARRRLWQAAREFVGRGGTLLLTTHYLEEVEALADRVVLIDHGRVSAADTIAAIKARVAFAEVSFQAPAVPQIRGIERVSQSGTAITLFTKDADRLVRDLVASQAPFADLRVQPASLEEAILTLTQGRP
ncbi:MAG: ABC transporter ATP-binding protein [Alphaproteobacteria bacterium]